MGANPEKTKKLNSSFYEITENGVTLTLTILESSNLLVGKPYDFVF